MSRPVYAIYDKVALVYSPIWPSNNDNTAIRDFKMQFASERVNLADYSLYCVGLFDSENGNLTASPLRFVYDGNELKKEGA